MHHQPSSVSNALPPYAVSLAERALSGALAVYAGAGLSFAEPTGLPDGNELARRVHSQLAGAFPGLNSVAKDNLVAIADEIAAAPGGEDALLQAVVDVAEFRTADPSYGHRALALLLLEGAVDVLTTNWDTCIERGYANEPVPSIVNESDLIHVDGASLLKIHGCAIQPSSLLLTSTHLATPPSWVVDQTRARLGSAVVVFVGIGDIAEYVSARLGEAVADVGNVDNIRVVSPTITSGWTGSQWAAVVPNLATDHRISTTADSFLEELASAYIYVVLARMQLSVAADPTLAENMRLAIAAICDHDAVTVLSWIRKSGVVTRIGDSVLQKESSASLLLALGTLVGKDIVIDSEGILQTSAGVIDTLVAVGFQPGSRLRRETRNRLEKRLGAGKPAPQYLVAGGIGWINDDSELPLDIVQEGTADDILDGPINVWPTLLRAEELIAI